MDKEEQSAVHERKGKKLNFLQRNYLSNRPKNFYRAASRNERSMGNKKLIIVSPDDV